MHCKERRHFLWLKRSEAMKPEAEIQWEKSCCLLDVTLVFFFMLLSKSTPTYMGLCSWYYSCQFSLLSVQVLLNKTTKGPGFQTHLP